MTLHISKETEEAAFPKLIWLLNTSYKERLKSLVLCRRHFRKHWNGLSVHQLRQCWVLTTHWALRPVILIPFPPQPAKLIPFHMSDFPWTREKCFGLCPYNQVGSQDWPQVGGNLCNSVVQKLAKRLHFVSWSHWTISTLGESKSVLSDYKLEDPKEIKHSG